MTYDQTHETKARDDNCIIKWTRLWNRFIRKKHAHIFHSIYEIKDFNLSQYDSGKIPNSLNSTYYFSVTFYL